MMILVHPEDNLSKSLVLTGSPFHGDCNGLDASRADAVYRKRFHKVVPTLFMVCLVCYLDRTNISLAAVGMSHDIGISRAQYGTAVSLFFVSNMMLHIPSTLVLQKLGAPLWLGIILIG